MQSQRMTTGREKMKIGANTCTPFLILSLALVKKERLKEEVQGEYIFTYSDTKIDRPVYLTFDDGRKNRDLFAVLFPMYL